MDTSASDTTDDSPRVEPSSEAGEQAPRGAGALLADARFGPYVVGQWLSNTGNWFHNVAIGILVFDITGSNAMVGLIGGLQYIMTLLLAPLAGHLGDRVDRRRLLLGAQAFGVTGAVGLALLLALADDPLGTPLLAIAGLTALIGVGYALGVPTLQAYVPSLVPPRDLAPAIALNSVTFNLARAIGPALAGALVAAAGVAVAFGVNASSFIVFVLVLVWLGRTGTAAHAESADGDSDSADERSAGPASDKSIFAGLTIARNDHRVLTILLGTVALGFATDPVITLAPALADRAGGGPGLVGGIGSAFGLGATASVTVTTLLRRRLGPSLQAQLGLATLAVGLLAAGLVVSVPIMLLGVGVAGAGFLQGITSLNTSLQLHIDDAVRGRVMALWSIAFLGVRPLAAGLDGVVADWAGVTTAMAMSSVVAAVGAVGLRRAMRGDGWNDMAA